nr:MAG TPA: hypothetical protein [Caudoviricetes sp.]
MYKTRNEKNQGTILPEPMRPHTVMRDGCTNKEREELKETIQPGPY